MTKTELFVKNLNKRVLLGNLIVFLLFILILGGLVFYYNNKLDEIRDDYQTKIDELGYDVSNSIKETKESLAGKINAIGKNLSTQIGFIDSDLKVFKKHSKQEFNTLGKLIDEIEEQSNIRLNELKKELADIKVSSADFTAIVNEVLQSTVSINTNLGQGSGAIINTKGYIITNVHVIAGASSIKVNTYDGRDFDAILIGDDTNKDIAILKIQSPNLRALALGNSDEVNIGQKVIALGNPAGLAFTVTEGIVSAVREASNGATYIQTDVPINPGNSGGPLVNIKKEVIGINNFKVGGFESLGFAISSNNAKEVADRVIAEYEAKVQQ